MTTTGKYWLLKAEPDSRIVKGKDVKFSVDDFESIKTSSWEGVRSYEARNLMKDMKVGDKALFYHSNCKIPGIAGFAEVSKEAYPDYTAWDASHPYYDSKSKQEDPKWFMVDLTFVSRAEHFVPLSLLRYLADNPGLPEEIKYIGEEGATAIKGMDLVRKGRLSVQRVDEKAWDTINQLAKGGGWEEMNLKPRKRKASTPASSKKIAKGAKSKPAARRAGKGKPKEDEEEVGYKESEEDDVDSEEGDEDEYVPEGMGSPKGKKRKARGGSDEEYSPRQRSRAKR